MYYQLRGTQFLQRLGILPTERLPQPVLTPRQLKVHRLPLTAPLPEAAATAYLDGEPPPDRLVTSAWPFTGE